MKYFIDFEATQFSQGIESWLCNRKIWMGKRNQANNS